MSWPLSVYTNSCLPICYLIDDARARKVAYLNNLEVMGSLGVLLLAKQKGLITVIKPCINRLRSSDIFISESLLEKILAIANESFV